MSKKLEEFLGLPVGTTDADETSAAQDERWDGIKVIEDKVRKVLADAIQAKKDYEEIYEEAKPNLFPSNEAKFKNWIARCDKIISALRGLGL